MGVHIAGTGAYLPEEVVENDAFSEERFHLRTGSERRHHASGDETSRLILREAAEAALEDCEVTVTDVDLVIAYSGMPDYLYPKDANLLIGDLGLDGATAWTVDTACATFISSMRIASAMLESGDFETVLVVMAMNWIDRGIDRETTDYSSLGDGAAAVVLTRGEGGGPLACVERTDSDAFDFVTLSSPFVAGELTSIEFSSDPRYRQYFGETVLEVAREVMARAGVDPEDIDGFLAHQVGVTLLGVWCEGLGVQSDCLLHTFGETGNMSAVNIPMILDHHRRAGRIDDGDILLFFAPGAGMHLAAMVWEYRS